nr:C69 family dipeptidase [Companilactobacillus pabuli]
MCANTFNTVVPFYANVNDTPVQYKNATGKFDLNNIMVELYNCPTR